MRRDHAPPGLTAAELAVAGSGVLAGVAVTALVAWRSGLSADAADLVTGIALAVAAAAALRCDGRLVVALLWIAALAWFAVDLAAVAPPGAADALARAAYVPIALLAWSALVVAGATRLAAGRAAVAVACGVALLAAAGIADGTLVVLGAAVAAAALVARRAARHGAIGPALLLGCGTAAVAVARLALPDGAELVLGRAQYAVLIVSAGLLAAAAVRRPPPVAARLDADGDLGLVLGRAIGAGPLEVAFAGPDGLLDAAGRPTALPPAPRTAVGASAVVGPLPRTAPRLPELGPLLALAGERAALRAALRAQLVELEASRRRLVETADDERRALEERLRRGPLARLAAIRGLVPGEPRFGPLRERIASTGAALEEVAHGLDPMPARSDLRAALLRMGERGGGAVRVEVDALPPLPREVERVVWFACSEAIANARKHAPGARIDVRVRARAGWLEAEVADGGPGGADAAGSGLRGLADRASAIGGALVVDGAGPGSRVVLRVPATRQHVARPRDGTDQPAPAAV